MPRPGVGNPGNSGGRPYSKDNRKKAATLKGLVMDWAIRIIKSKSKTVLAVDAIGVGAGVASSSMLDGIIGYKSSYGAIKTDQDIVRLPNVHYTKEAKLTSDYKNLRCQCTFTLAGKVNKHEIASRIDGKFKEYIIEELSVYQDVSQGDGKRMATMKQDVKDLIGRSPDHSDTWIMRMYFEIKNRMLPEQTEEGSRVIQKQKNQFETNKANFETESNK